MATKEGKFLPGYDQSVADNKSTQFSNFNLNKTHQSSNSFSFDHAYSKSNNNKKFCHTVTDSNYPGSAWNKSTKDLCLKSLKKNFYNEAEEEESESRKRLMKSGDSDAVKKNSSTLSLHIAAYENSDKTSDNKIDKDLSKKSNAFKLGKFVSKVQDCFEFPRGNENNNKNEPEIMQFKPSQKLLDPSEGNRKKAAAKIGVDEKAGAKSSTSAGGRSDTDLQHLRARFHATQFRFTSALAAEHGKASDGAFRIQLKGSDNLKPTKPPPKDIYEPIEAFENEEGLKGVEAKEPEYDMFSGDSSSPDESGLMEEWDPAFIAEIQKKCNTRWREAVMEEDPLTDKDELQAIRKRRTEEAKEKEKKKKDELKPVKSAETKEAVGGGGTAAAGATGILSPSLSKESLDSPGNHAPAFSPGALPSAEPLIPATNILHPMGSQETLGITLSRESLLPPNAIESETKQNVTTTTKGAEPLFDCLENEIVLDDSNLTEITNGLKEGMTYDNALVTDDLKKKLLEIDANKEKVEEELVRKALEREDTPVKTDATANKIVEALTDYEVIAKTVAVEDSKMMKEYFDGSRKADDEVIAALDRVIDRILDRAADFYPNKEELALFLRNRGTAKSHLLDAMLSRKGGWLQNMYGSAYSTALAIYSGANKTVEVVGKGLAAAKDVAGQSATMARDYAATTVDVVNRSYSKANELAEQSALVARDVATKGSEMYSKAADVASYSTEQARRVASVTALFAGKVSSVVSSASSLATKTTSTTSAASSGSESSESSVASVTGTTGGGSTSTSDSSLHVSNMPTTEEPKTGEVETTTTASTTTTSTTSATASSATATSASESATSAASSAPSKGTSPVVTSSAAAATTVASSAATNAGSADEMKSTEEEEKSPARNPIADSPVPLTFNGFLHCPSPPQRSPVINEANGAVVPAYDRNIFATIWRTFTLVLMALFTGPIESRRLPREDRSK